MCVCVCEGECACMSDRVRERLFFSPPIPLSLSLLYPSLSPCSLPFQALPVPQNRLGVDCGNSLSSTSLLSHPIPLTPSLPLYLMYMSSFLFYISLFSCLSLSSFFSGGSVARQVRSLSTSVLSMPPCRFWPVLVISIKVEAKSVVFMSVKK